MPYAAIAFQETTTGEIRIAHYFNPQSGCPAVWTDAFGASAEPPSDITDWGVVGGA